MSTPLEVNLVLFSYGGIGPKTHESIMLEIVHAARNGIKLEYTGFTGSALICKARSQALSMFLREEKRGNVCFMLDHDMSWTPGDICETARLAHENQAIVGAVYSKRVFGQGYACCNAKGDGVLQVGTEKAGIAELGRIGTGFIAIPRGCAETIKAYHMMDGDAWVGRMNEHLSRMNSVKIVEEVLSGLTWCPDQHKDANSMWDFFRTLKIWTNDGNPPLPEPRWTYLSEDFSFCERAKSAGIKIYVNTKPRLRHWGEHGFTVEDGDVKLKRKDDGSPDTTVDPNSCNEARCSSSSEQCRAVSAEQPVD